MALPSVSIAVQQLTQAKHSIEQAIALASASDAGAEAAHNAHLTALGAISPVLRAAATLDKDRVTLS